MTDESKKKQHIGNLAPEQQEQELLGAFASHDIEQIYFNDFTVGYSHGDCFLLLKRNNQPIAVLNASYTVTKTLAASLQGLVNRLEDEIQTTIKTTHEIDAAKAGE